MFLRCIFGGCVSYLFCRFIRLLVIGIAAPSRYDRKKGLEYTFRFLIIHNNTILYGIWEYKFRVFIGFPHTLGGNLVKPNVDGLFNNIFLRTIMCLLCLFICVFLYCIKCVLCTASLDLFAIITLIIMSQDIPTTKESKTNNCYRLQ